MTCTLRYWKTGRSPYDGPYLGLHIILTAALLATIPNSVQFSRKSLLFSPIHFAIPFSYTFP